jgi:hypothetical protein
MTNISGDKSTLKISDINGRERFSVEIITPETEISTEFLTKGVYFVTVQNEKFRQTIKLIIL